MFQKRYADENDWIEISERIARRQLKDWFKDVDFAISDLRAGKILQAPHTFWRWIPVEVQE